MTRLTYLKSSRVNVCHGLFVALSSDGVKLWFPTFLMPWTVLKTLAYAIDPQPKNQLFIEKYTAYC